MKISQLIYHLLVLWFKYGNNPIDIIIEDSICQMKYPLGDLAYSPREKRVKLLSEGFS